MENLLEKLIPNVMARLPDFFKAIGDTLVMVGWSGIIAFVFGLFFGIVVTVTRPGGILENKILYQILDKLINFFIFLLSFYLISFTHSFASLVASFDADFETYNPFTIGALGSSA